MDNIRHTVPTQPYTTQCRCTVGHVGGLLALFLGASIITVIELFDIALCRRRACASSNRKRKPRDRRYENSSSNHVASFPVGLNHRGRVPASKSATLPAVVVSNNKTATSANCATVPRQKAICLHQAETDI